MYRVQVDIMGHKLLGKKNLIYLMDALFTSEHEVNQPDKWQKEPWNNDWTSSIFISQDPVAIESVGFDFLYYEFDGTDDLEDYPHYGAVDDYLHQAADPTKWATGITYDPENDGVKLTSLGVHEHWNNSNDMQYTRNLGTGNGIELIQLTPTSGPSNIELAPVNIEFSAYPNPTHGIVFINYSSDYNGQVEMKIFDMSGRIVFEKSLQKTSADFSTNLNIEFLNNGTYILSLSEGQKRGVHTIQLIK